MFLFDQPGEMNTDKVLELAEARGKQLGINSYIVATTRGVTALKAARIFTGANLICVTHCTGFVKPDFQEMEEEVREELLKSGIKVLTSTHSFGGIGRAIRKKFKTYEVDEIIANTLRRFGEGTKVAIEITLMAADAGLVKTAEDVISIGGTGLGADTALVICPANTHGFFDLKVREFICKPSDF